MLPEDAKEELKRLLKESGKQRYKRFAPCVCAMIPATDFVIEFDATRV